MSNIKKRKEEQMSLQNASTEFAGQSSTNAQNIRNNSVERFGKIMRKRKTTAIPTRSCDENSQPTSPTSPTSSSSDNDENRLSPIVDDMVRSHARPSLRRQMKQKKPIKNCRLVNRDGVYGINSDSWTQRKKCCGLFYENKRFGAIMLDTNLYKVDLCSIHAKKVPLVCEKKEELIKFSPPIKSLPPKKQHFLRQCMLEKASIAEPVEQSAPIDYSKNTVIQSTNDPQVLSSLQKLCVDSGKVVKRTPRKLAELNAAKNLVKLCTAMNIGVNTANPTADKPNIVQTTINEYNENKNITNTVHIEPIAGHKYNDNSSDSGYDETLHDATQLNRIAQATTRHPVVLSNGVKLHVKPENLLLAANLAGVSRAVIQTTQVIFRRDSNKCMLSI